MKVSNFLNIKYFKVDKIKLYYLQQLKIIKYRFIKVEFIYKINVKS